MAQASLATASMPPGLSSQSQASVISAGDLHEMQEYDRIVKLRDAILSGNHPRIKVPAGVKAPAPQPLASRASTSSAAQEKQGGFALRNLNSYKANSQRPAAAATSTAVASKPFGSHATQIDPLFLTKSDELIKAELQLQRQRLERALREELEERRAASKSAEQATDFDLSDILAKALTLVQATAAPLTDANQAANASDLSDSFDENTFYSSQHDTPEPSSPPKAHNASEDVQMQDAPASQARPNALEAAPPAPVPVPPANAPAPAPASSAEQNLAPSPFLSRAPDAQLPHAPQGASAAAVPTPAPFVIPGGVFSIGNVHGPKYYPTYFGESSVLGQAQGHIQAQVISSNGSGSTSRSGDSGNTDSDRRADHTHQAPYGNAHQLGQVGPVVRAHNLSPYAPRPAHVSPLATARQQPNPDPEITILQSAPGPVAALRQEQGAGTSPESSPQGDRGSRRKKKKNKRKATERAADRPVSPIIKAEPRSPSPLTPQQLSRGNKRQRPLNRSQHELNYDEAPRAGPPVEVIHDDLPPRSLRDYDRVYDPYPRDVRHPVAPASQRLERPVYEQPRPEETVQYVRRVHSPGYVPQYTPSETRPMRSATYSVVDPIYREAPSYHAEGRMSVRPVLDRARSRSPVMLETRPTVMAPPRPPTRIIRDEFGREYIEPPPHPRPMSRHSVAPGRIAEPEVIYEPAPMRTASRVAHQPDTFERDGIIYRRVSPVPTHRRVVTQPEYPAGDYREYRQRDYSARPAPAPPSAQDLFQFRGDGRPPHEMAPDYTMRAASVRPPEHVRYEYPARVASVRPDMPVREYAASVHPEARREVAPVPVYREYSVRPAAETDLHRQEYSVRPVERYYDRPIIREDEVQFIEPPRTIQREIVYEDGHREVYR